MAIQQSRVYSILLPVCTRYCCPCVLDIAARVYTILLPVFTRYCCTRVLDIAARRRAVEANRRRVSGIMAQNNALLLKDVMKDTDVKAEAALQMP